MEKLSPYVIRCDGGTQSRLFNDETTIAEYKEAMLRGEEFAPVVVFFDGANYWLADGFHRVRAAKDGEIPEINVDVRQGTQRDAILFSVGANAAHGLKRNNADKRRAVLMLLNDSEWSQWSDRVIAEKCGVGNKFVSDIRNESVVSRTQLRGRDGKSYPPKKARPERKAPPSPKDSLGAAHSSLPQNKSEGELRTAWQQGEQMAALETGCKEVASQCPQNLASECPNQETHGLNGSDERPSNSLPVSFETTHDLCAFLAGNSALFAEDGVLFEWLVVEATRLVQAPEIG